MNRFSETLQYVADQGRIIIDAWVPFSVFLGFLGLATWRTVTWIYRFRLENAKSSLETLRLENEALHRNLALADLLNSKGNVDLINDLHVLRDRLSSKTDDKNSDVKQLGIKLEELNRSLSVLSSKRSGIGKEVYQAGSNANGTFIRFTDGSQTCEGIINEGGTESGQKNWVTLPAASIDTPKVDISPAGFVSGLKVTKSGFTYTSKNRPLPEAAMLRYKSISHWK
jgi:hypothetical protein